MIHKAIWIRHGESTGNAGVPCHDLALPELTGLGWRQAKEVAAVWPERPSLIVTSPFLRTQQTAQPTIERFADVPVAVWPIQEFTYLEPSRWNGTTREERRPHLERYWEAADPAYCDGPGAEGFATLLMRAEEALARLKAVPGDAVVYLFSHGQFMQAVRSLIVENNLTAQERMRMFWRKSEESRIGNADLLRLRRSPESVDKVGGADWFVEG